LRGTPAIFRGHALDLWAERAARSTRLNVLEKHLQ
jgi:hypothetical protein